MLRPMRVRVILTALGVSLACQSRPTADEQASQPATNTEATPSAHEEAPTFQALLDGLDDTAHAGDALLELRRRATAIEAANDQQTRAEMAAVVLPGFVSRWPTASASVRDGAVAISLALAGPEAMPLWRLVLAEGSPEHLALILDDLQHGALEGLEAELLARLTRELDGFDRKDSLQTKLLIMLLDRLGDLRVDSAVDLLISTLEGPELPRPIQRALVSALGRIGDPRAVDALIVAQFRLPDPPSTQSIGERSIRALGAIGEDALPAVLAAFAGKNQRVNELVREYEIEQEVVRLSMLKVLGVIGSPRATEPVLQAFPRAGCGRVRAPRDEDERMELLRVRGSYANALGFIADPAAVPILCSCNVDSEDPSDVWEIASALGRIGGEEALACLSPSMTSGQHDSDSDDDELETRWQTFRWAIIAAPPSKADKLVALLEAATPDIRAQLERDQLDAGLRPLQECGEDTGCYREVLGDDRRLPFEREVAAFNLARRAAPGDLELAAALAAAFAIPDPEVRIHMAWLAGKVAAGRACPECVRNLEAVLVEEESSKSPTMQAAWILARQTIDKLHAGTR